MEQVGREHSLRHQSAMRRVDRPVPSTEDEASTLVNRLHSRIAASFRASLGDVVFGMADCAASIFGLVEGVAVATTNAYLVVLLTGTVEAAAAAVSRARGAYLDASASTSNTVNRRNNAQQ